MTNSSKVATFKIGFIVLGIIDVLFGLILISTIILLQGISFPFFLGFQYLIFGVYLFKGKIIDKLLNYWITTFSALSAMIFIMMGLDKEIPEYYKTPIFVQIILVGVIVVILLINILFSYKSKGKGE